MVLVCILEHGVHQYTDICVMVDSLGVTRTYASWYVQQQLLACRTHQLVYIRECIYQV